MKTSDREAMGKLYVESWNDNPYKDDVQSLRKHQNDVDRESGRIQPIPRSGGEFETDPNKMQSDKLDSRFENAKYAWVEAILQTKQRAMQGDTNARTNLSILKPAFKSWAKDLNLLDDPNVRDALS